MHQLGTCSLRKTQTRLAKSPYANDTRPDGAENGRGRSSAKKPFERGWDHLRSRPLGVEPQQKPQLSEEEAEIVADGCQDDVGRIPRLAFEM